MIKKYSNEYYTRTKIQNGSINFLLYLYKYYF